MTNKWTLRPVHAFREMFSTVVFDCLILLCHILSLVAMLMSQKWGSHVSVPCVTTCHWTSTVACWYEWLCAVAVYRSPYIIGTMNQSTSASVANLQLHHNFRWVLCSPHTEPVRGFLSRYLRRRLISTELQTGLRDTHLERVVSWLPSVLERVNKFLENQCSSELTIGTCTPL